MKRLNIGLLFLASITTLIFAFIVALSSYAGLSGPILNESTQLDYKENLPFALGEEFIYKVKFNGISVGRIEWKYLGRLNIDNKLLDILYLSSDVKILKLFSIQNKEKLYIDSNTHLPLKVERQVESFGKQEEILEEYNQKENYVNIIRITASGTEEKTISVKAPIHNVIALLFFFPKDIKLELGESFSFNLPTQRLRIKVKASKLLDTPTGVYEVYVLEGRGRKFKVWLEKEKRIPLRIEFPVMLGRISISKVD